MKCWDISEPSHEVRSSKSGYLSTQVALLLSSQDHSFRDAQCYHVDLHVPILSVKEMCSSSKAPAAGAQFHSKNRLEQTCVLDRCSKFVPVSAGLLLILSRISWHFVFHQRGFLSAV